MPQPADILITHARCFTAEPNNLSAEAVAVRGNRIVFVGNTVDAHAWRGARTRVIDAQGCTLMPGFIDSHFHLLWGSIESQDAQLADVKSLDDLASVLRRFAAEFPDREWLVGRGLLYGIKLDRQSLTRHDLDAINADRPLIVFAYDTHTAWANTEALRRANLLHGGKVAAPNSEIVIGSDGWASGELREAASDSIVDLIPPPSAVEQRTWLRRGLRQAAELGITSVHNMDGNAEDMALYAALEDLGELTLRVYVPYRVQPDTPVEALAEAVKMRDKINPRIHTNEHELIRDDSWRRGTAPHVFVDHSSLVRAGSVKFFMDGVIESYTALLLDEYADRPGYRGDANYSAEHFNRMAIEADRRGLQIAVHAIGDAAVRRTLDGFEAARRANGVHDSRHRIEHIELIHPDDVPRFAQLGVIASMQPLHVPTSTTGLDVWPQRVGPARWDRSFAWQTLREAGARLVFGSDWPVVGQNPLRGIHAALNRAAWQPGGLDQRQTLADTLIAYTRDAAYAEFQEDNTGQLRVGMLADVMLLSDDIFGVPVETIDQIHPVLVMCDGRIVFEI